jgi:hypothetical protein
MNSQDVLQQSPKKNLGDMLGDITTYIYIIYNGNISGMINHHFMVLQGKPAGDGALFQLPKIQPESDQVVW